MGKEKYTIGIDPHTKRGLDASRFKNNKNYPRYSVGVDEVGRGPLAGPVTVAAVAILLKSKTWKSDLLRLKGNTGSSDFPKLKDSKKLTPRQREIWFDYIQHLSNPSRMKPNNARIFDDHPNSFKVNSRNLFYAVASVSPKVIDRINISQAANLAATRAVKKILTSNKKLTTNNCKVFLDGGLYLSNELRTKNYKLKTVVRGDEKIPAIMLASIAAKVSRDRLMVKLHKKYPLYGLKQHKGYGTKKHIKAIKKYGATKTHRLTFLKKILRIKQKQAILKQ